MYDGNGNRLLKVAQRPSLLSNQPPPETTTLYLGGLYERQVNTTTSPLSRHITALPNSENERAVFAGQPPGVVTDRKLLPAPSNGLEVTKLSSTLPDFSLPQPLPLGGESITPPSQPKLHPVTPSPRLLTSPTPQPSIPKPRFAPLYTAYNYSDDFNNFPGEYWTLTTEDGATVQALSGQLHATRPSTNDTTWNNEVSLKLNPKVSFGGPGTTSIIARMKVNTGAKYMINHLDAFDYDANRYFSMECGPGDASTTFLGCAFGLRELSGAWRWNLGQPFTVTTDQLHTFELRYKGNQRVEFLVDGVTVLDHTSSNADWNGIDWVVPQWNVLGWSGQNNTIDASLDYFAISSDDPTLPNIPTVSGPPVNTWYNSNQTVNYTASDAGSGLKCVKAQWDSVPSGNTCYTDNGSVIPSHQGSKTLYIRAWDWAGNSRTASYVYKRDTAAPSTPSMIVEPPYSFGSSNTVAWNVASDAHAGGVTYQVQHATNSSFSGASSSPWQSSTSKAYTNLTNCQTYYFRVRSRDSLNNTSSWSTAVSSKQDYAKPTGSISINSGAAWSNTPAVNLSLTAHDDCAGSLQIRLRNGTSGTWGTWQAVTANQPWTLTASDGIRTVQMQIRDTAGQISQTYQDTITLDITPPSVPAPTLSQSHISPNGDGQQDTTTLSATITEANPNTWLVQVLDASQAIIRTSTAGPGNSVNWAWDGRDDGNQPVADGQYSVRIKATDQAGNTATGASQVVVLDTVPPGNVILTHPTNGGLWPADETIATNQESFTLSGTTDQASDTVTVNGQPVPVTGPTNAFNHTLTLILGLNTITINSQDLAGNRTTLTRAVLYDTAAPTLETWLPNTPISETQPPHSSHLSTARQPHRPRRCASVSPGQCGGHRPSRHHHGGPHLPARPAAGPRSAHLSSYPSRCGGQPRRI